MLRLARLSKAPLSLNTRFTTPGRANPHFIDRPRCIDPTHPAVKLGLAKLPVFVSSHFTIRALPNPVLQESTNFVPISPLLATRALVHKWQTTTTEQHDRQHSKTVAARQIIDAHTAALAKKGRRNISLLFHTSKKETDRKCVVRRRLRTKMKTAITLVVGRNLDAVATPDQHPRLNLVHAPSSEAEHLVLKDWTYLVVPNLSVYTTPIPVLVQAVRIALLTLTRQSLRLEQLWSSRLVHIPRRARRK